MQKIFLPSRFYLTFPGDDSWNFDKILIVKTMNIYAFIQICDLSSFLADFKKFWGKLLCETFFVNSE